MEKIWLKSYAPGVRPTVDVTAYTSIVDTFQQSVSKFAKLPSFSNMGVTQTYEETGKLVEAFASYLQNVLKLPKGARVAIMTPNLLQYPVVVFGVLKAGCVVANVNPLYTPRELEHQLKDSGASAIVVLENFAHTVQAVVKNTEVKHVIVTKIGDLLGGLKGTLVNLVVRYVKRMVPKWDIPNAIPFRSTLAQGRQHVFREVPITLEDTAFLQYTGGTTGVAKGVDLTHGNIVANMQQADEWIRSAVQEGKETIITALPLYHIFSLTVNLMIFTKMGAKHILITNPRDIPGFIQILRKNRMSVITGVNTLFNALTNHPDFEKVDFSNLKIALGGGMSVQRAVAQKWKSVTGVPIVEAYGLTETSPGVSINPIDVTDYTGSIGLPISNTEIEIRGDDGQEVGIGETGELWVRGPQVMRGYWNRPEETAKVLDERGFLATGDIAIINEQGYIKLVDRKKDMIVVSGFNVYPNEIEDVIAQMPGILEVACVGVSSEKTGEMVKVFAVKKDPNLSKADIITHCRQNLTAYKVPKEIEFRDELPKSNVGKILRKDLKG